MIDINGISRVLREFKNGRHKRNPCVIMGDAPEMDELFVNFRNSARIYFNDPNDFTDAFTVMDKTRLSKEDKPKRVTISRSDVLMLLDSSDSRGFKLFGKHKEKIGQYGILLTKKGIVDVNHTSDIPGTKGGFISWEGYQFCKPLLVDLGCNERFLYDTSTYPGEFVSMWYGCGLKVNEFTENVLWKINKVLDCNDDWVEIVKAWGNV